MRQEASPNVPIELTVAYLGPPGTHSHLAAITLFGCADEFGFRYEPQKDLLDVVRAVRTGSVGWGVIPYFNTTSGPVRSVYPALLDVERGEFAGVEVVACILWPVSHDLLGIGSPDQIRKIYSNREAIEQCRQFLERQFESAVVETVNSTAEAAHRAAKEGPAAAAIASGKVREFLPSLRLLYEGIQDDPTNSTRFLLICGRRSDNRAQQPEFEALNDTRQTWVVFESSVQTDALSKILGAARRWGISTSALTGLVTNPDTFTMCFLLELDWPVDTLKIRLFLSEVHHLCPLIAGCPFPIDMTRVNILRRWLSEQLSTQMRAKAHRDAGLLDCLPPNVLAGLQALTHYRVYSHASVRTMEDVWGTLGIPASRMLKTQVYRSDSTGQLAFCCLAGNRRVSSDNLARILGSGYRRLSASEFDGFNLRLGATSPLTAPDSALVVMDRSLPATGWLFMGSGHTNISIAVDLSAVTWPREIRVADISEQG